LGARAHARRPGLRPLRRPRVPRRAARRQGMSVAQEDDDEAKKASATPATPARGPATIDPETVPVRRVTWRPSYRLIPSRYPTVGLYRAIAHPPPPAPGLARERI